MQNLIMPVGFIVEAVVPRGIGSNVAVCRKAEEGAQPAGRLK